MARASSSESQVEVTSTFSPGTSSVRSVLPSRPSLWAMRCEAAARMCAGAAVIALQADDLRAGKVVLEAQDVVDLGAAPAIDRLVVVADAADVLQRPHRLARAICVRASDGLVPSPPVGEGGARSAPGEGAALIALRTPRPPRLAALASHPLPKGRGERECGERARRRRCAERPRSAPAAAARDTARRWCPDIRRPGCSGSAPGTAAARRGARGTAGCIPAAGRRSRRR